MKTPVHPRLLKHNSSSLRLDDDVRDRLDRYRDRLKRSIKQKPSMYPPWMRGRNLSLGDALFFLLEQHERRGARRDANRARKEVRPVVD